MRAGKRLQRRPTLTTKHLIGDAGMAKKKDTTKALQAMERLVEDAQSSFLELHCMANAIASLVHYSEHGEIDRDLASATNCLHQLAEKAAKMAGVTDPMSALAG